MKISLFVALFLALVSGLIVVFIIDDLEKSTVSTPFLLGIILMGLSLRQDTILVASVALIYIFLTYYALIRFQSYIQLTYVSPHPYFWLFQRMGLFLVLSALSIYLAYYRTGAERVLKRLQMVLSKLPVPVILSSSTGEVIYANDAFGVLQRQATYDIEGMSYFDFIHIEDTKGKSIRTYFTMFEGETNGVYSIEINPFGPQNKMNAQMICIGLGAGRILVTVVLSDRALRPGSNPNPGRVDQPSFNL